MGHLVLKVCFLYIIMSVCCGTAAANLEISAYFETVNYSKGLYKLPFNSSGDSNISGYGYYVAQISSHSARDICNVQGKGISVTIVNATLGVNHSTWNTITHLKGLCPPSESESVDGLQLIIQTDVYSHLQRRDLGELKLAILCPQENSTYTGCAIYHLYDISCSYNVQHLCSLKVSIFNKFVLCTSLFWLSRGRITRSSCSVITGTVKDVEEQLCNKMQNTENTTCTENMEKTDNIENTESNGALLLPACAGNSLIILILLISAIWVDELLL